jgi:hypothetical protein
VKKSFLILFSFVYFLSSIGLAVNLHYCGSKFVSASFTHSDESKCCRVKMKKKGCCKEKSVFYKVQGNQDKGSKILSLKNNIKQLNLFYTSITYLIKLKTNLLFQFNADEPPDGYARYTYLVNRVFRI